MSSGVCGVPPHNQCEPVEHITEGVMDRQDSRGTKGDPWNLCSAGMSSTNPIIITTVITFCSDISEYCCTKLNQEDDSKLL